MCYRQNLASPEGGREQDGLANRLLRGRFEARLAMYLVNLV
jgi:hypothetical protein